MKRNQYSRVLVGTIAAAALASFALVAPAQGGEYLPLYKGYTYGGRFVPAYGGYVGYGYTSAYGYADPSPGLPVAPSYKAYGLGNGFGTGGTYRGVYSGYVDHDFGASHRYVAPDRAPYDTYGSRDYTPYGYRMQHDYGY